MYSKEYYEKNKVAILTRARVYRTLNKEKIRASEQKWYNSHKEQKSEYQKKNRESKRKYEEKWNKEHTDSRKVSARKSYNKHAVKRIARERIRLEGLKKAVVYTLSISDATYVGETILLSRRLIRHRFDLENGRHPCKPLQALYHGWQSVKVEVREELDIERIDSAHLHSKYLREKAEKRWKLLLSLSGICVLNF